MCLAEPGFAASPSSSALARAGKVRGFVLVSSDTMASLTQARCPKCGAEVPLSPGADRGTCGYCGTVAYVAGHGPVMPNAVPGLPSRSVAPTLVAAIAVLGVAVLCGGGFFVMMLRSSPTPAAPPEVARQVAAPKPEEEEPAAAAPVPAEPAPAEPATTTIDSQIFLSDVDGDGHPEIVATIESRASDESTTHYAVFDRATGAERARTPAIEDLHRKVAGVIGARLLLASDTGELVAYDLVTGAKQWTTGLGEQVSAICQPSEPGFAHVETDAERRLAVDLTTGRQTETSKPCGRLVASGRGMHDPRDRVDHSAPIGVEGILCGGVRVMGSENYSVPDACRARGHVDTDRLDGMVGHRLWKVGGATLVFGVRTPGAYVPMVGRVDRGRLAWKSEVPLGNPLEAETGGPRHVAIAGDRVVIAYETGRDRASFVTAFAIADGTRAWTVPMPGRLGSLLATDDGVVVQAAGELLVLDPASGATRARAGAPRE